MTKLDYIDASRGITIYGCKSDFADPIQFLPTISLDAKASLAFLACACDERWNKRFQESLHYRHAADETTRRLAFGLPYPVFCWHFCTSFIGDISPVRHRFMIRLSREVRGWHRVGCNFVVATGFPFVEPR